MPNRLATESSPYLRQHAANPVEWYPWGEDAFVAARATDRPILLSVGYAACHWCHVMAHESFEDPATAAVMNELFVNVKVDREERPDVDNIYMQAVQAMTGRGGWPMTVFLTPDGDPFYGGTYFPPTDAQGMPGFTRLMRSVSNAWTTKRDAVHATTATLRELYANAAAPLTPSGTTGADTINAAVATMLRLYDTEHHGFGDAPKFPHAMALDFLLRHGTRHGDERVLGVVTESFLAMARGGIHDQIGGGFARYATDREWIVPHFEKMLYDNALIARLGVHLVQSTASAEIERVTRDTLDWVLREMTGPEGGIYSSLDADSEGEEGRFYVWSREELRTVLGEHYDVAVVAYGISAIGNFDGHTILTSPLPVEIIAGRLDCSVRDAELKVASVRAQLLAARDQRVRPGTDQKRVAAWNGLMLSALSDAARVFDDATYLASAERLSGFLVSKMIAGDRVARTWIDGVGKTPGFLEDQAAVAAGFLSLYQATGMPEALDVARALATAMLRDFWDADARSFYDTAHDHATLITRPRDISDNATPSGSSLACDVLLHLASLDELPAYRAIVAHLLDAVAAPMVDQPLGFGHWLGVADRFVFGAVQVALIDGVDGSRGLQDALRRMYVPTLVLARGPATTDPPMLVRERPAIGGAATAYVCRDSTCGLPTTDAAEMARQLRHAVRRVQ
ncbi:MAG: thioredoxin domain-containing protein [Gemmatimonadaceae bacterium]|nr:thioredoxin domain-containing protein [Gemmatimonadaceae bacterium]